MVISMNKKRLLATAIAAAAFSVSTSYASGGEADMEKCKPVNAQGKNIVKEHKADCASQGHSCAGHNKAGDHEAWILVPKGDCAKINKGDFKDISQEVKDRMDMPK